MVDLIYSPQRSPPELPDLALVQFDDYCGTPWTTDDPSIVPIPTITREWFYHRQKYCRTMIPLAPAHAITIYKSQGFTLTQNIIVDLGPKE